MEDLVVSSSQADLLSCCSSENCKTSRPESISELLEEIGKMTSDDDTPEKCPEQSSSKKSAQQKRQLIFKTGDRRALKVLQSSLTSAEIFLPSPQEEWELSLISEWMPGCCPQSESLSSTSQENEVSHSYNEHLFLEPTFKSSSLLQVTGTEMNGKSRGVSSLTLKKKSSSAIIEKKTEETDLSKNTHCNSSVEKIFTSQAQDLEGQSDNSSHKSCEFLFSSKGNDGECEISEQQDVIMNEDSITLFSDLEENNSSTSPERSNSQVYSLPTRAQDSGRKMTDNKSEDNVELLSKQILDEMVTSPKAVGEKSKLKPDGDPLDLRDESPFMDTSLEKRFRLIEECLYQALEPLVEFAEKKREASGQLSKETRCNASSISTSNTPSKSSQTRESRIHASTKLSAGILRKSLGKDNLSDHAEPQCIDSPHKETSDISQIYDKLTKPRNVKKKLCPLFVQYTEQQEQSVSQHSPAKSRKIAFSPESLKAFYPQLSVKPKESGSQVLSWQEKYDEVVGQGESIQFSTKSKNSESETVFQQGKCGEVVGLRKSMRLKKHNVAIAVIPADCDQVLKINKGIFLSKDTVKNPSLKLLISYDAPLVGTIKEEINCDDDDNASLASSKGSKSLQKGKSVHYKNSDDDNDDNASLASSKGSKSFQKGKSLHSKNSEDNASLASSKGSKPFQKGKSLHSKNSDDDDDNAPLASSKGSKSFQKGKSLHSKISDDDDDNASLASSKGSKSLLKGKRLHSKYSPSRQLKSQKKESKKLSHESKKESLSLKSSNDEKRKESSHFDIAENPIIKVSENKPTEHVPDRFCIVNLNNSLKGTSVFTKQAHCVSNSPIIPESQGFVPHNTTAELDSPLRDEDCFISPTQEFVPIVLIDSDSSDNSLIM